METRSLGQSGLEVSALGLGCMGMTPIYGTPDADEAKATVRAAIDAGVTLFDTADAYNAGRNEELLGQAVTGVRESALIATKFGNIRHADGRRTVNGRPEYVSEACDNSLRRLGVDHIDLFYLHRVDPDVPIEDTVGAMGRLVESGKVRAIGLSEAGPGTIRAAHNCFPLAAVQTEYSLASRDVERDVLPTCRELGIGFVAYAPLGRGLLSGEIKSFEALAENDRRRDMPRFQSENLQTNVVMVQRIAELAAAKNASCASLVTAWLLARGNDVVPIPGCSRRATLNDTLSALEIDLSEAEQIALEQALQAEHVAGTRYPEKQMRRLGL